MPKHDGAGLRFGTGTTVTDFAAYRQWLTQAEGTGFHLLTTGDSQSLWAECFTTMAFAAAHTTRARLGITVSNPMTRHPAVCASASCALQDMSGGRFVLGMASGDSALRNIGTRPARLQELGAYVEAVQGLTSGGTAHWGGDDGHDLRLHWHSGQPAVPVLMAAEGPRTQQLAGRIADGVILSNSLTPHRLSTALEHISIGAHSVGRRLEDLELWFMCNLVFAPTEAEGIDRITSVLAGTANHVFRFTLEDKGLPDDIKDRAAALMAEYDSRHHAQPGAGNPNNALIDKYGLRDYLARQGTIAGPPGHCAERILEVAELGVRNLLFSQFGAEPSEWLRTFENEISPRLASHIA